MTRNRFPSFVTAYWPPFNLATQGQRQPGLKDLLERLRQRRPGALYNDGFAAFLESLDAVVRIAAV